MRHVNAAYQCGIQYQCDAFMRGGLNVVGAPVYGGDSDRAPCGRSDSYKYSFINQAIPLVFVCRVPLPLLKEKEGAAGVAAAGAAAAAGGAAAAAGVEVKEALFEGDDEDLDDLDDDEGA